MNDLEAAVAVCEGFHGCYLPPAPDVHTTVDEVAITAGDEGEMPVDSEIRSVSNSSSHLR